MAVTLVYDKVSLKDTLNTLLLSYLSTGAINTYFSVVWQLCKFIEYNEIKDALIGTVLRTLSSTYSCTMQGHETIPNRY